MSDSFLDEGFLLAKTPGQNQPRRVENAKSKFIFNSLTRVLILLKIGLQGKSRL